MRCYVIGWVRDRIIDRMRDKDRISDKVCNRVHGRNWVSSKNS